MEKSKSSLSIKLHKKKLKKKINVTQTKINNKSNVIKKQKSNNKSSVSIKRAVSEKSFNAMQSYQEELLEHPYIKKALNFDRDQLIMYTYTNKSKLHKRN